jgi:hypothetical protein
MSTDRDYYRPEDPIAAIRGFTDAGLTPHDISTLTGIGVNAVLQLIASAPCAEESSDLYRWERIGD